MTADPISIARAVRFANEVVGKPWAKGATGPDAFSCWGLAQTCEKQVFDRDVAMIAVDEDSAISVARAMRDHPVFREWQMFSRPLHGDVVKMFRPDNPNHVGVFLENDRSGVLHIVRGGGVCFDNRFLLPSLGWSRLEFWRPRVAS